VDVEVEGCGSARLEEMIGERSDGDGVVETESKGREMDGAVLAGGGFGEPGTQTGVCGDASADGDLGTMMAAGGTEGFLDEDIDDGFLEGSDDVGELLRGHGDGAAPGGVLSVDMIEDGGLEPGEGEVEGVAVDERTWEIDGTGVAGARETVDDGAAMVGGRGEEVEEPGDLVEGFAGGIVDGGAEELGFEGRGDEVEIGVSARDDEGNVGIGDVGGDVCGVDVGVEVINGEEGEVSGPGEGFCGGGADEEGADESGTVGDGDGMDVVEGEVRVGECGGEDGDEGFEMGATGDFGDDATETGVKGFGRGDGGGALVDAIGDDGGGGLVAGGFDAEDVDGHDNPFHRLTGEG